MLRSDVLFIVVVDGEFVIERLKMLPWCTM